MLCCCKGRALYRDFLYQVGGCTALQPPPILYGADSELCGYVCELPCVRMCWLWQSICNPLCSSGCNWQSTIEGVVLLATYMKHTPWEWCSVCSICWCACVCALPALVWMWYTRLLLSLSRGGSDTVVFWEKESTATPTCIGHGWCRRGGTACPFCFCPGSCHVWFTNILHSCSRRGGYIGGKD